MSRRRTAAALALLAALTLAAGCGDADEPSATAEPPAAETLDPVPDTPPRWRLHTNRSGGFALGVPPGWVVGDEGATTLVRSLDRLVAIEITPDRTDEAQEVPAGEFATRALAALPGFEAVLSPSPSRPFAHAYEGLEVEASGTVAGAGVKQRLRLIVLRREAFVTLTVAIAANATPRSGASERLAERVVGTIRTRPVTPPAPPEAL